MAQEMEQNESLLRSAYLAPLHDTRREREQVRQWIRNTQTRVQSMRDASRLLGEYVLGVGSLSLDDNREARTHLESAWHSGYRSPDAACPLGLALVRLYNDEKKEVDTIRSRELRETKHRQLLAEYRDPALKYLHEGEGASHVPREYVEGLIAYLENRYDECLEKCSAAMTRVPWFYQAKILEGDVYLSRGNQKRDAGDREGAMTEYEMADQAYRLAARVGESDPLTYARIATVWKLAIFSELYGAGKDMSLNRQRALDAASDALRADPENADVHILIANVCRLWSASEVRGGRDPGEWLARSFDSARTALRFRPMDAEAHAVVGVSHQIAAQYAMEHGEDPMPSFTQAIDALERARQLGPRNDSAIMNLANCYWAVGEFQLSHGQDPRRALGEGIRNLERAIELYPGYANLYNNLGNCRQDIGLWEMAHGADPSQSFADAIQAHTTAMQLNPKHTYADGNLGNDYACRARYKMARGQDPHDDFSLARAQYEASLLLTPGDPFDLLNLGDALADQARFEIWTGADPSSTIREALQRLGSASKSRPDFGLIFTIMSSAWLDAALYDLDTGRPPRASLDRARDCAEKGLALDSTAGSSYKAAADVDILEARWRIQRRQSPELLLGRARQRLEKAVALEPTEASYPGALAEVHRFQAEWNIGQAAQEEARGELSEGIQMARKALAIDGNLADAAATLGVLSLLQARLELDPARRSELALEARQWLEKSLTLNRYLQRESAASLAEARALN